MGWLWRQKSKERALQKKGTQLANISHLVVEQEVPLPALSVLPVMGT